MNIHPTAIVSDKSKIHATVQVGPFTFIGPNVRIGENTVVGANCFLDGHTDIGSNNTFFPFVSIGCPPQDIKFSGEQTTFLKIGEGNHFREFVTVHLAEGEGNSTLIGDKNLFMAYVHVAHNCQVGNQVIMSNCATLAGHVEVGDRAVLGGFAGIHQFCKVGKMVMIGGKSKIVKDVPPFVLIDGNPARIIGLNSIGLKRNEVQSESIEKIRRVFKIFFRSNLNLKQAQAKVSGMPETGDPLVKDFLTFMGKSERGIYSRLRGSDEKLI